MDTKPEPFAFPSQIGFGMTLRDAFAIAAMPQAWDINRKYASISGNFTCEAVARDAYEMADAMLAERAK